MFTQTYRTIFGIAAFDMEVAKLKEHYGEPYNKAYDENRVGLCYI